MLISTAAFAFLAAFAVDTPTAPHPVEVRDILAWKHTQAASLSPNGQWFAYQLVPNEGDAEVIVRNLKDGKEQHFAIGEMAQGGGGFGFGPQAVRDPIFSADSKWIAFSVTPTKKEGLALKKQRKPAQRKTWLVELATGKKTEFEKTRAFSFNGEKATWLAVHRYGAEAAPGGVASPAVPPVAGAAVAPTRPQGADLLLHELASGQELNLGNVSEFAFNKAGERLAFVIDAQDQAGNGIQYRDMNSGAVLPLDSAKAWFKSLAWTEKGDALAALRGVEDKAYEDKIYTALGFKFGTELAPEKIIYEPKDDKSFPSNMSISGNRTPFWLDDLSAITFGIQEPKKKKPEAKKEDVKQDEVKKEDAKKEDAKKEDVKKDVAAVAPKSEEEPDNPDLILWHWQDRRLPPMQQVQEMADKNFSYLALYRPVEKKFVRLADEKLRTLTLNPRMQWAVGTDNRDYERMANLDGRRYSDVYGVNLADGERKIAVRQARWYNGNSPDGTHVIYYQDGNYFTYDLAAGVAANITAKVGTSFIDTEDDHNVVKPPTRAMGWSSDSKFALLTDNYDIWQVPVGGGKAVNLTGNGKKEKTRYDQIFVLDPDERGTNLTKPFYVRSHGEWTKKGGIALVDPAKPGAKALLMDDASYGGLLKAKHEAVFAYARQTAAEPGEYFSAGADLAGAAKISDSNAQRKNLLLTPGSKLIEYTSAKGDKLQGALFLPAGYEAGKRYPTIVYIYERLSQSLNVFPPFTTAGFAPGNYTSNGYAVLMPDIKYTVNDPGMSSVWCVLPALKAAVATGIVDEERVGLQGHSWGGYQTAYLVTQTKAFRAAVAGAPLTDMVSMYSSIYWNSGSANQPIFESSQGRFSGGYLEQTDAYIRNSPVYHANKVETPLMILHNDKDGAVDFTQGIEYFNTLRRQQKQVIMLEYKGENHGLAKPANRKDYTVRMKEFFDYHLKSAAMPGWMEEGVPLLKMKEHLEERSKLVGR